MKYNHKELAQELSSNSKLSQSVFGGKTINPQKLEKILEEQLQHVSLDFFKRYAISHDGGATIGYFGHGAIQLFQEKRLAKNLPAIIDFEFQIAFKSPKYILSKQDEWRKLENSEVYSIPSDFVFGLEHAFNELNAETTTTLPPLLWVKRMKNPTIADPQNISGCYGFYKTSDSRSCKVYWSMDVFNSKINAYSPIVRHPLQFVETKFLLACYKKEYGKAFIQYEDEERWEDSEDGKIEQIAAEHRHKYTEKAKESAEELKAKLKKRPVPTGIAAETMSTLNDDDPF
jgi:hypothetical protein